MAKYHINPATGNPGVCTAQDGNCRYGGEVPHFSTEQDARTAYEAAQSGAFSAANLTRQVTKVESSFTVQGVSFDSGLWTFSSEEEKPSFRSVILDTRNKSMTIGYDSWDGNYCIRVLKREPGNYWGDGPGVFGFKTIDDARAGAEKIAFEDTKKHLSKLKSYAGKEITDEMIRADLGKVKKKAAKERAEADF